MKKMKSHIFGEESVSLSNVQRLFFRTQFVLIMSLAMILGAAGTLINLHFETEKRDRNLQNVAKAIARSPILTAEGTMDEQEQKTLSDYLDVLKETLDDVDVISVVDQTGKRIYHSNHALIGTRYEP